jgi:hypothetical protein
VVPVFYVVMKRLLGRGESVGGTAGAG